MSWCVGSITCRLDSIPIWTNDFVGIQKHQGMLIGRYFQYSRYGDIVLIRDVLEFGEYLVDGYFTSIRLGGVIRPAE